MDEFIKSGVYVCDLSIPGGVACSLCSAGLGC